MSSFVVLFFLLGCILLLQASKGLPDDSKNHNCHVLGRIGGVIYQSSRIGREQKIAMEMAIHDFEKRSLNCSKLVLHPKDLDLNSAGAVSAGKLLFSN